MLRYLYGYRELSAYYNTNTMCDLYATMDKYLIHGLAKFTTAEFAKGVAAQLELLNSADSQASRFITCVEHVLNYPEQQVAAHCAKRSRGSVRSTLQLCYRTRKLSGQLWTTPMD